MDAAPLSYIRCVVFDVGETLVDETRMWSALAEQIGLTPFTVCGIIGALIPEGRDHQDLWDIVGIERPVDSLDPTHGDLYPDALECLAAVRQLGFAVGVAGNQPASIEQALSAAGLTADFVASSAK